MPDDDGSTTPKELHDLERACQALGVNMQARLELVGLGHIGFILAFFTIGPDGSITYVSNVDRDAVIEAMRQLIERHESGTVSDPGTGGALPH